jgi:hypothetical protein
MSNEAAVLVTRRVGDRSVHDESVVPYVNQELQPMLKELLERLNSFLERPQIPLFNSSPVTDADFDPYGNRPPKDGVISGSLADGKLYIRRDGGTTHVPIVA